MRRTKILATVGPATDTDSGIRRLMNAGVNGFRLNFSHGTTQEHRATLRRLHAILDRSRRELAIVADVQGPKIRIGELKYSPVKLVEGSTWRLDISGLAGDSERVSVELPDLLDAVRPGDPLLLGDGNVELVAGNRAHNFVETRVVHGGAVQSHAGLFLPRAHLRANILGKKDRSDLRIAMSEGVDFVALSFVRDAADVKKARSFLESLPGGNEVGLIAKIERAEALAHIDAIVETSDALMVARGDLGIEVPLERLALEQKMLLKKANAAGKPAIVATQMLLSMLISPRPTRAEATDVANAVLDGADVLMLSEESAVGKYPFDAVRWLSRIAEVTEGELGVEGSRPVSHLVTEKLTERSVAEAAVSLASDIRAAAIVTPTHSGRTARLVASLRPRMAVVALSSQKSTRRKLALVWGVEARHSPAHLSLIEMRTLSKKIGQELSTERPAGPVVLTAGYPLEGRPTNLLTVVEETPPEGAPSRRRPERSARREKHDSA